MLLTIIQCIILITLLAVETLLMYMVAREMKYSGVFVALFGVLLSLAFATIMVLLMKWGLIPDA